MKIVLVGFLLSLFIVSNVSALTTYKGGKTTYLEPQPTTAGQLIFDEMGCPICHGHQGGGDGFLAGGLKPKPRDFTDFKVMSRLPDMIMFEAIRNGIPGTSMPSWELTDQQIWDVISYIKTFLADAQEVVSLCINQQKTIDITSLNISGEYEIHIDKKDFLNVKKSKDLISIKTNELNTLKYFRKSKRRMTRVHVLINDETAHKNVGLVIVRINDCLK